MIMRRLMQFAACLYFVAMVSTGHANTGKVAGNTAATSNTGAAESPLALARQIAESSQTARTAIEKNDVRALTELHVRTQQSLAVLRERIDESILRGAWKASATRPRAFEVLSRLEGMRVLSRICVTFLNDYPNPTGKISASVADATERLLRQAQIISEEITAVNELVPASAPAR